MKSFRRIFKYVRPQWLRVVSIIAVAVVIAFLFSLSFATVIPLLKVMMGEEGLHSWVDRKICCWRYEVDFYVPESADFANEDSLDIAYYLLITRVDEDGLAEAAGLLREDRIVGIGVKDVEKMPRAKLLEELAAAPEESVITLQLMRVNKQGGSEAKQLQLKTGKNKSYIDSAINFAKWAVSFVPRGQTQKNKGRAVVLLIVLMGVVTLIRCAATFYQKYMAEKVVQVAIAGLREDAFAHVMTMPMGFFVSSATSDTISRLLGDIPGIGRGVKVLLGKALREPLKAMSCLIAAMIISFKLTLIFLCCAPPTIGLAVVLGRKIKKNTTRSLMSSALMLGRLKGAITSLGVVKVYNRQEYEHSAYQGINRKFLKRVLRIAKIEAATGPMMEILGMIAGSAALLIGVSWVTNVNINMQPSSFFGLLILLGTAAESLRKASDVWNKIQAANAAAERVFAIVDEPPEFEKPDATKLSPLKEKIEFRDVVFTYPSGDKPVLNRVSLMVKAGRNVAVVGPNGSGKTTLVNLIPRFYNIDSGSILIDGQDIRDGTLRSLRNQIGLVTQNVITFNDTIAANIAYGRPGATIEEIIAAARRSYAHEFIEPLPLGYDTVIGEQGAGLSGGQLQRIVIARAILKNPEILIFDEATSQVDADSEAKIHKAIKEIMKERTSFIIAHRFSTVITADIIVVMDNGRIIAQGQHEELIKDCALYQNLYETQLLVPE